MYAVILKAEDLPIGSLSAGYMRREEERREGKGGEERKGEKIKRERRNSGKK
jgi:hypothetical protein